MTIQLWKPKCWEHSNRKSCRSISLYKTVCIWVIGTFKYIREEKALPSQQIPHFTTNVTQVIKTSIVITTDLKLVKNQQKNKAKFSTGD